jgi:hypothetical protein
VFQRYSGNPARSEYYSFLPLSHLPDLAGLDVIILALENYHDYQAAAELAQRYQVWWSALPPPTM